MKNNCHSNEFSKDLTDCLEKAVSLISQNTIEKSAIKFTQIPKSANRHLLLGLSGGTDSTALLLALSQVISSYNFGLTACHINHGLRAEESEIDAEFCQNLCNQLNIDCQILELDDRKSSSEKFALGKQSHVSEATLRDKRYELLSRVAKKNNISFLLTAHTLDDQVETLMFRLLRGTGLTGLKGIEFCRELTDNLSLLRPLLKHSKIQCQNYLNSLGIKPRYDSSNSNEIYSRNYIRHTIFPTIHQRFPDFAGHLDCLREIVSAEDDYLDSKSRELFSGLQTIDVNSWSLNTFASFPLALQRRILGHALKERSIELSFKRLDEIISLIKIEPNGINCLNLNRSWRVRRTGNKLLWQQSSEKVNSPHEPLLLEIAIPGLNPVAELNLALLVEPYQAGTLNSMPFDKTLFPASHSNSIFADLSLVKLPLVLRKRQPGDRIHPMGMSQSIRLKKYIHTHKPDSSDTRVNYFTVLLADQDEVLWLPGIGMSEKIKVRHAPSHILSWQKI